MNPCFFSNQSVFPNNIAELAEAPGVATAFIIVIIKIAQKAIGGIPILEANWQRVGPNTNSKIKLCANWVIKPIITITKIKKKIGLTEFTTGITTFMTEAMIPVSLASMAEQMGTVAIIKKIISQFTLPINFPMLKIEFPCSSFKKNIPEKHSPQAPMMDILDKLPVIAQALGIKVGKQTIRMKSNK